jgi:hypothetical protein
MKQDKSSVETLKTRLRQGASLKKSILEPKKVLDNNKPGD